LGDKDVCDEQRPFAFAARFAVGAASCRSRTSGVAAVKVLHVITGLNVGGAENMLAKLLEGSVDSNECGSVVSLLEPGPIAERIRACGVRIDSLNMRQGMATFGGVQALSRIVRAAAPDVIHGWMYHGNLAASLASMMAKPRILAKQGVPLVWNVRHSLADSHRETWKTRALLRVSAPLSRQPAAIIYNSQVALEQHQAHGFSPRRSLVLPNGFDCAKYKPDPAARERLCSEFGIDPGALIVGIVARLHPMKDHAGLIDAVALARAKGLDIHLVMIGDGLAPPPERMAAQIALQIPADRISLGGARSDVASLMPGLDILAVSSAWGEAFPNVIGEALACGVPVVATDVGDSAVVVGRCGLIVPPSSPQDLANGIISLSELGPEGRRNMGIAGRQQVAENYSLDAICKRYRTLHQSIL
jgi:glycosyltransferase involved in cell wall biosynthesis